MCGRYTLTAPDPAALRARFGLQESVDVRPRFNVAPGDAVLAVTAGRDGRRRDQSLRWGLVPSWAPRPDLGLTLINARIETVAQRPAFRAAFAGYRCLIPADGFYEWRALPGARKQPFHITRADGAPFAFAGLWSIWHGRDGETLRTCTILTRPANEAVAPLHDRMPVILDAAGEAAWLNTGTSAARVEMLLRGLPARDTAVRPVAAAVNDARHDAPDCLAPPAPDPRPTLF